MKATGVVKVATLLLVTIVAAAGPAACSSEPEPKAADDASAPATSGPVTATSATASSTATTDPEDDVLVASCTRDPASRRGKATVVITNRSTGPASYFVGLVFVAGPTNARHSSGQPKIYPVLDPGEAITTEFTSTGTLPDEFTCVIDPFTRS